MQSNDEVITAKAKLANPKCDIAFGQDKKKKRLHAYCRNHSCGGYADLEVVDSESINEANKAQLLLSIRFHEEWCVEEYEKEINK
jgi:hypothetical protein